MLREFTIEGFKSFGLPGASAEFAPLTFAVGANASGKSNLLLALKFLRHCFLQGVGVAVEELGGASEVRHRVVREKNGSDNCVRFSVYMAEELSLEAAAPYLSNARYELKLNLAPANGEPLIAEERLTATVQSPAGSSEYRLHRRDRAVEIDDPLSQEAQHRRFQLYPQEAARLVAANGLSGLGAILFREDVASWRFFNIAGDVARRAARESDGAELSERGENLAVILHEIQKSEPARLNEICSWLQAAVPGFERVSPIELPGQARWAFEVEEESLPGALNAPSVSDGTVRLLALLVIAAWVSKKASLICIEEPENGVHPHLVESLVSALRTVSAERQFILTTHSSSFLDYLQPDELLVVDKREGASQIRRASETEYLDVFRNRFTLGELWEQGMLQGIPA